MAVNFVLVVWYKNFQVLLFLDLVNLTFCDMPISNKFIGKASKGCHPCTKEMILMQFFIHKEYPLVFSGNTMISLAEKARNSHINQRAYPSKSKNPSDAIL